MRTTVLILALVRTLPVLSQDCSIPFTAPLFGTRTESGIVYGQATAFDGSTTDLPLNLHKPVGDGQTERPLVIAIHGGGFTSGNRNDLDDYCRTLAGMGWAAATISYRLGFHGTGALNPPYAHDPAEVLRATYRAMQDAKGAIRFLKGRHAQDSTSTTKVLLVGFSAGAFTALQAAYLDEAGEKPSSCGAIGPVVHGANSYPRPDLGGVDGTLAQNGFDASVLGVVNMYGALIDTAYMASADGPALYSYHQTLDPVVGCGHQQTYWGVGLGVPDNYPLMFGSCAIEARVRNLGFAPGRYSFHRYEGNAHDIHDPLAILVESLQWMRDLICPPTTGTPGITGTPGLRLHPNPGPGPLTVEWSGGAPVAFELRDATGRLVHGGTLLPGRGHMDLGHLPDGLYLFRAVLEGRATVERLVLAR